MTGMNLFSRALPSTVAGVLLVAVLASACGGDSDDSDPDSAPSGSPTGAPSKEEWTDAHTAYHDLGEAYDAASQGAADYQAVVRGVHDKSPAGVLDDPEIAAALEDQEALAAERDRQIAALGEEPAMRDPELKEAYDAFAAAAEGMNTFQDGYNEAMPVLLRALDLCPEIFSVRLASSDLDVIPGVWSDRWIKAHNRKAAPCLPLLDQLDQSENSSIRKFATNYRKVIDQRNALMTDLGDNKIGFDQTVSRLEKINKAFTRRNDHLTNFSAELGKLSSADEYQALDAIFEEELGAAGSPSSSDPAS
jgi:hypothetical protein